MKTLKSSLTSFWSRPLAGLLAGLALFALVATTAQAQIDPLLTSGQRIDAGWFADGGFNR